MITCAKCSKENQDHYKFCLGCGAELPRDTAPRAFSAKTPPHGMKAAANLGSTQYAPSPPFAPPPNIAPPGPPPPFAPGVVPRASGAGAAPSGPPPAAPPYTQPPLTPMVQARGSAPAPAPAAPTGSAPVAASGGASMVTCPTCAHLNPPTNKFCASCGTVLASVAPPAPVAVPTATTGRASLTALRADGSDAGTFQLREGPTLVGRDLGGVFGGDSYLSPKHATFRVQGGRVTVKDEGSLNGVYIKVARDNPTELKAGGVFRIGQEIIRFDRLDTPTAAADGVERLGSPADGIVGRLSLVTGRDSTGNSFVIHAHGIHLGRERGDILFPEDGYVSGLHCRVAGEAGRVFLTDLGSSNGTYIRFGDERELRTGDILLMGQQLFRVTR